MFDVFGIVGSSLSGYLGFTHCLLRHRALCKIPLRICSPAHWRFRTCEGRERDTLDEYFLPQLGGLVGPSHHCLYILLCGSKADEFIACTFGFPFCFFTLTKTALVFAVYFSFVIIKKGLAHNTLGLRDID